MPALHTQARDVPIIYSPYPDLGGLRLRLPTYSYMAMDYYLTARPSR